jgi:hypothetical protein
MKKGNMLVNEELSARPASAFGSAMLAWLLPGLGHVYLKCFGRAGILGGSVWLLFLIGLLLGGHVHGLLDSSSGFLNYIFGFFDLGTGLLYLVSRLAGIGNFEQEQIPTSEYGNVFIMVSGLLNYLLALDAYDLGSRRKS